MVPARFARQGQGCFKLLSVFLFLTSRWCQASAIRTVQASTDVAELLPADSYSGAHSVLPAESYSEAHLVLPAESYSEAHRADFLESLERHLLQTDPIITDPIQCYRGQVQCPSGIAECYDYYKSCDGNNDCSDGSDESHDFCAGFQCEYSQAKCPSSLCTTTYPNAPRQVARKFLCDGIQDCRDNSDEDASFCASFDCSSEGSITCPGAKQCIPPISSKNNLGYPYGSYPTSGPSPLCDGVKDCGDGSDEDAGFCSTYVCENEGFKCSNVCIGRSRVCDGHIDCPDDGSDEDPSLCGPGYNCTLAGDYGGGDQHCPSGTGCYPGHTRACDGVYDCLDGSDEDPAFCANNTCSDWQVTCPGGVGCLISPFLCDGTYNCLDKSDERADVCADHTCVSGQVKCPSGNGGCLSYFEICDGLTENSAQMSRTPPAGRTTADLAGRDAPAGSAVWTRIDSVMGFLQTGYLSARTAPTRIPFFAPAALSARRTARSGAGMARASTGSCAMALPSKQKMCDDGSDEDTSYCQSANCPLYFQKCADGIHCVGLYKLCDGTPDCPDGSDETADYCNSFPCQNDYLSKCPGGSGQCFSNTTLCDGVADCLDSSDEDASFCASYDCTSTVQLVGTTTRFKCPGTNVCVWGNFCNGYPDCPDHSDESPSICNSGAPPASGPSASPPSEPGAPPPTSATPPESPGAPPPFTASPPESPGAPPPVTANPPESPGAPPPYTASPPESPGSPAPATGCDPYGSFPNQCFNAQGTASVCCPGQCPNAPGDAPACGAAGPSPALCDPTSSTPNQCFNANGDQSVCCPGGCPGTPEAVPKCG